jgi:hypothetical protein
VALSKPGLAQTPRIAGEVEEPFGFYARNPTEKDLVAAVPVSGELVSVSSNSLLTGK